MHRVNAGLTLLVPLKADQVEAVSAWLVAHDAKQRLPFAESKTTHFATITVIPASKYRDRPLKPILLFATSYCGPTRIHVFELVRLMADELRELFSHCEGFDPECTNDDLEAFLLEHDRDTTFYSGMQHLSPQDVRRQHALRKEIEAYLDERQARGDLPTRASDVRYEIQQFVLSRSDLRWAREPWQPTLGAKLRFLWRSLALEGALAALALGLLAWPFVDSTLLNWFLIIGGGSLLLFVLFLLVCFLNIRRAERQQAYVAVRPPDKFARDQAATQTRPVINEFTLGGPIKEEGLLRPVFLRILLWVVARLVDGVPGMPRFGKGISIPTVATARWIVGDGGRRLMFISNYTNSGEAYVRDFIETKGGAENINISFGFGHGYPKTKNVYQEGAASNPNAYLWALSENQLPTLFWYGPYTDISIDNIKRNRQIREGLFGPCNEQEARDWLRLL